MNKFLSIDRFVIMGSKNLLLSLSISGLIAISPLTASIAKAEVVSQDNSVESDEATIRRLSQEWIEQGFSPGEDTQNYTYEKYLAPYYDSTPGAVVLHDNNDPQMRIETDARAYSQIWEELFANLDYVGNKLTRFYQVEVKENLAFSSFTADTIVESEGKRTVMPVFYTLGWRKTPDGWRIIHEHGSNLITEESPVGQKR